MKASVLRHRKPGKEAATPHTEHFHERDKAATTATTKELEPNWKLCRYCGVVIVWAEGCPKPLKELRCGVDGIELCYRCLTKIGRYYLSIHGI